MAVLRAANQSLKIHLAIIRKALVVQLLMVTKDMTRTLIPHIEKGGKTVLVVEEAALPHRLRVNWAQEVAVRPV